MNIYMYHLALFPIFSADYILALIVVLTSAFISSSFAIS